MKAYPRGFMKVFWWTQSLLAISGFLLLPGMLVLRLEWDVPFTTLLGSRVALAATHALFAFITLLVLGALLPIHVRHGLRQHKNKRSGTTLLSVLTVLILTGWGILHTLSFTIEQTRHRCSQSYRRLAGHSRRKSIRLPAVRGSGMPHNYWTGASSSSNAASN